MSDSFEDRPPSGSGLPSKGDMVATFNYLLRHGRKVSIDKTKEELLANGFTVSRSTVDRALKHHKQRPKPPPESLGPLAVKGRQFNRKIKKHAKPMAPPPPVEPLPMPRADPLDAMREHVQQELSTVEVADLASIIGPDDNLKKNNEIAILENKIRMALNIIVMKRLIAKPDLLLIDMRGGAALIDSMTLAAKLSGGASFEVIAPGDRPEVDGDGMKDITPTGAAIQDFKLFRLNNGKGA